MRRRREKTQARIALRLLALERRQEGQKKAVLEIVTETRAILKKHRQEIDELRGYIQVHREQIDRQERMLERTDCTNIARLQLEQATRTQISNMSCLLERHTCDAGVRVQLQKEDFEATMALSDLRKQKRIWEDAP